MIRMASGIGGDNEPTVGWVSSTCQRSTFDVLWSCLAVVLVCTYKVIHLNLPACREAGASWQELLFWKKWLRKFKWMAFMALSPELLIAMALGDFLWSRQNERRFARTLANQQFPLGLNESGPDALNLIQDNKVTSTERSKSRSLPF